MAQLTIIGATSIGYGRRGVVHVRTAKGQVKSLYRPLAWKIFKARQSQTSAY